MRLSTKILLAGAGLLISAGVFAGKYNTVLNIGDPMPAFANLPSTDDKTVSSADLTESIVVLVSLANHCPWVQGLDGGLVELASQFKDKDVRVIAFNVSHQDSDRLPAMKEHAKKTGYNFTYIFDESQELGRKLGATRTPEYFVFDKDRKLVYMGLLHNSPAKKNSDGSLEFTKGEPNEFYVANAIKATFDGKPVDPAETRAHGCSVKYL